MSRGIEDLHPLLQQKFHSLAVIAEAEGLKLGRDWVVTCTARHVHDQIVLYLKGRATIALQNDIRKKLKMPEITLVENNVVTWVIADSRHVVIPGIRPQAEAFDFCIMKDGKTTWDLKVSVDNDAIPDYQEIGQLAEQCGLVWGGRWTKPDCPHIQLP